MYDKDPIEHIERMVKEIHDSAGNYTKPVLRRYPLLFGFLVTFSLAAILHGFELFADQIEVFDRHPALLVSVGIVVLFFTGSLYKKLEKGE